jgi:peptide chain release factor subunit 1
MEPEVRLKKLINELEQMRGRHTELISLYIPAGYNLNEIVSLISQEISLTQNVKSKTVRKNVIEALTKILQHLRLYKQTPPNGLVIFCGNVSKEEGKSDIRLWALEPIEPIKVKLYWCDQKFELEPLKEQIKEKDVYGLIVLDTKEATIGLLKGKHVKVLKHMESLVPGKFIKGGQSAARFQRVREGLIHDWYKKIAEVVKEKFSGTGIKGILIGGPGISKEHFFHGNFLETDLQRKVLGIVDVGYTSEAGLHELVEKGIEYIKESKFAKEKEVLRKFFDGLKKDSELVTYGLDWVLKALYAGAVETLLVSEDFDWKEVGLVCTCGHNEKRFVKRDEKLTCPKCGKKMEVAFERDAIEAFEEIAKDFGTEVFIVSRGTKEGEQFYQLGGIGALLRWKVE